MSARNSLMKTASTSVGNMNIEEFIEHLQKVKEAYGNIEIMSWHNSSWITDGCCVRIETRILEKANHSLYGIYQGPSGWGKEGPVVAILGSIP